MPPRCPRLIPDWEIDRVWLVQPQAGMAFEAEDVAPLQAEVVALQRAVAATARATLLGQGFPDIWLRDCLPLVTDQGLVPYRYDPPYAPAAQNATMRAAVDAFAEASGVACREPLGLTLEGGNLVHDGGGTAAMTEAVLSRNPGLGRSGIERRLREALGIERLVLVPEEPGEPTGHVDALVRWLDPSTIMVADYGAGPPALAGYGRKVRRALERALPGRTILPLATPVVDASYDGWPDGCGMYLNFLRTRNGLHLPLFGLPEDAAVVRRLAAMLPVPVVGTPGRLLAAYGGAFNCASWGMPALAPGRRMGNDGQTSPEEMPP